MKDDNLVKWINEETIKHNRDNITRTHAYQLFYLKHPEIKWSFLASMVSRNAGWNMCDLEGEYFPKALKVERRKQMFLLYEKANWLIFSDAYPQLLLYEWSKRENKSYFYLCPKFFISNFMEREWNEYLFTSNEERLLKSLVMNEQFLIQQPIIESPYFKEHVFHTIEYQFQDLFQFSYVIFPTLHGTLYGKSVKGFQNPENRIRLGYSLATILFFKEYYNDIFLFATEQEHTGSRWDYEQYLKMKKKRESHSLRELFPLIPHRRTKKIEGIDGVKNQLEYLNLDVKIDLCEKTEEFLLKQERLKLIISMQQFIT